MTEAAEHTWRVIEHPKRQGMYVGFARTPAGRDYTVESENREHLERTLLEMQIPDDGLDRFLAAWKRGVRLAGPDLFHGDPDSATDKEQLRPRWNLIEAELRSGISHGERLFLMEMCSFYNNDWMQKHKSAMRMPRGSLGKCAIKLDLERLQVLADLLVSYRGW